MRNNELQIKIITLAYESKLIKKKATKLKQQAENTKKEEKASDLHWVAGRLSMHRLDVVRPEARHSLLLYGFMRGLPYRQIEQKTHNEPDWDKITKMASRFGVFGENHQNLLLWISNAKSHLVASS